MATCEASLSSGIEQRHVTSLESLSLAQRPADLQDNSSSSQSSPVTDSNSNNVGDKDNHLPTPASNLGDVIRDDDVSGEVSPALTLTPSPVSEGQFLFDLANLQIGKKLGRGGFGTVYKGSYGSEEVAIKTFHAQSTSKESGCRESYERELYVLRRGLGHENLVRLLGATCMEGWKPGAQLIMEYMGCGTLQRVLDDEKIQLDMYDRVLFGTQMVYGLQYLHDNGLVHLDIKPANMLFGLDGVLRLADFGACHVLGMPWLSCLLGTPAYRAPELFHQAEPTPAADVFSLGVVFWCMDTQQQPYPNMSPEIIIFRVKRMKLRPQLPAGETTDCRMEEYRALYTRCWSEDITARPTLEEVKEALEKLEPAVFSE